MEGHDKVNGDDFNLSSSSTNKGTDFVNNMADSYVMDAYSFQEKLVMITVVVVKLLQGGGK